MAYPQATKDEVRDLYVNHNKPLTQAASEAGVPYSTARAWKDNSWDTARAARRISAGGVQELTNQVIEDFVVLFKSTIDELNKCKKSEPLKKAEALSRLSDAYMKTINAAGKSNPKLNKLAVAMEVIQHFGNFIKDHAPEAAPYFIDVLEPFSQELVKAYG